MYSGFMTVVVAFNVWLIVLDTDAEASCEHADSRKCRDSTVRNLDYGLLCLYTFDCLGRVMVYQEKFVRSRWNIADTAVLVVCYVEAVFWLVDFDVTQVQVVRVVRFGRVMRLVKLFRIFPSLYAMLQGLVGAFAALGWGFLLILMIVLIWAIIAVQFVHHDTQDVYGDDSYCAEAFTSVERAVVFFFQTLVIGDSWGECTRPLVERNKGYFWLMSIAFVTVQLGLLNLILAVIVDTAAQVREADVQEKAEERQAEIEEARSNLLKLCKSVDEDDSGDITHEELLYSFDTNLQFKGVMNLLGLERNDMERMMSLMDVDDSGSLSYGELVDCIAKAGRHDIAATTMMMQLELKEIRLLLKNLESAQNMRRSATVDRATMLEDRPNDKAFRKKTDKANTTGGKGVGVGQQLSPRLSQHSRPPLHPGDVSLTDAFQPPSLAVLDHQLQLLGQVLTDRLQTIATEAEQEVVRLVCSVRQLNSTNEAGASTAPTGSAGSANSRQWQV